MLKCWSAIRAATEEFVIVERMTGQLEPVQAVLSTRSLIELQQEADRVYVDPALMEYAVRPGDVHPGPKAAPAAGAWRLHHVQVPVRALDQNLILTARARAGVRARPAALLAPPRTFLDMARDVMQTPLFCVRGALGQRVRGRRADNYPQASSGAGGTAEGSRSRAGARRGGGQSALGLPGWGTAFRAGSSHSATKPRPDDGRDGDLRRTRASPPPRRFSSASSGRSSAGSTGVLQGDYGASSEATASTSWTCANTSRRRTCGRCLERHGGRWTRRTSRVLETATTAWFRLDLSPRSTSARGLGAGVKRDGPGSTRYDARAAADSARGNPSARCSTAARSRDHSGARRCAYQVLRLIDE